MNPIVSLLDRTNASAIALVALTADGEREEITFARVSADAATLAGRFASLGVTRGDVVLTLMGSRPEWVLSMIACWRLGAVALPCHEMLTAKDLTHRIRATDPKLIIAHEKNLPALSEASNGRQVITVPDPDFCRGPAAAAADLAASDPAVVIFTSGTTSDPKGIVHGQRWISGQHLQASEWFAARPGTLAWCTAAPGWSKSARNAFLAPWLCGAAALLHDARFDPHQRSEILEQERVATLCQAPTEYRVMAARGAIKPLPDLKQMVAAGEALDSSVIEAFIEATANRVRIRDGYGQTETNHLTSVRPGDSAPHGSMGRALSGIKLEVINGELIVDPATVPTFYVKTLNGEPAPLDRPWHTGDLVHEEGGWLFFEGRADDIISSAGYRIGPLEVESALATHPAVAESAVVAAPDAERGHVVKAIVVLRDGFEPGEQLVGELQQHVKAETAPYKYPRVVEFADSLPRTNSGKLRRSALKG